ncbi:hypothetical protein F7R91_32745 [Streptomyces luteolifulvus]|uniref:Uncharacterized protein n=1 Tax=Streptomyces luteolifulvus TaxID=2615112 RepID=A0A6H9UT96_9ACTN|nr:hypothetical protein [Streptomyces luteolifulvus]KAB1141396.1 hypothetical protein F7R91_32745 [Streptomyces luteolifulvus]
MTDSDAARIQRAKVDNPESHRTSIPSQTRNPSEIPGVRVFGSAYLAIEEFAALSSRVDGSDSDALQVYLSALLRSNEALVPHFNSPPSIWSPLREVAEQASAVGIGVTMGEGSVPILVGAYIGGLFLVKFVTPIVSEVGNATAAGIGAKIRTAFGVEVSTASSASAEEGVNDPVSPPVEESSGGAEESGG